MLGRSLRLALMPAMVGSLVLGSAPVPQAQTPRHLALVGGMLLDGYEAPPINHAAVLIEGNKIVKVGPASDVKIPADATIIDTSGRTMMPGMMETHAHLAIMGHGDYGRWFAWLAQHKAQFPPETRLRDLGQAPTDVGSDRSDRPRRLNEAPSLSRARSDRARRGARPADAGERSGRSTTAAVRRSADAEREPARRNEASRRRRKRRHAVEEHIQAGRRRDQVPGAAVSYDEYKAIVDAAHKHNVKVHAHLYAERELRRRVSRRRRRPATRRLGGSAAIQSSELVKAIVDGGRPVVPTAAHRVFVWPATLDFPERLQHPRAQEGLAARDLRRGAGLAEGLPVAALLQHDRPPDVLRRRGHASVDRRAAPSSAWAPIPVRR